MSSTLADRLTACMTRLDDFHNALPIPAYHYGTGIKGPPWIVWTEDGAAPAHADGEVSTGILTGSTDLYTNVPGDPRAQAVWEALDECTWLAVRLESIQYEDDTGLLHYEWVWEAVF